MMIRSSSSESSTRLHIIFELFLICIQTPYNNSHCSPFTIHSKAPDHGFEIRSRTGRSASDGGQEACLILAFPTCPNDFNVSCGNGYRKQYDTLILNGAVKMNCKCRVLYRQRCPQLSITSKGKSLYG